MLSAGDFSEHPAQSCSFKFWGGFTGYYNLGDCIVSLRPIFGRYLVSTMVLAASERGCYRGATFVQHFTSQGMIEQSYEAGFGSIRSPLYRSSRFLDRKLSEVSFRPVALDGIGILAYKSTYTSRFISKLEKILTDPETRCRARMYCM